MDGSTCWDFSDRGRIRYRKGGSLRFGDASILTISMRGSRIEATIWDERHSVLHPRSKFRRFHLLELTKKWIVAMEIHFSPPEVGAFVLFNDVGAAVRRFRHRLAQPNGDKEKPISSLIAENVLSTISLIIQTN